MTPGQQRYVAWSRDQHHIPPTWSELPPDAQTSWEIAAQSSPACRPGGEVVTTYDEKLIAKRLLSATQRAERAEQWIRQYALPALDGIRCYSVSTSNGSQCCYPDEEHLPDCPIGQALAHLPEGVRLPKGEEE